MSEHKIRVAIIGGGLSGLLLAIALVPYKHLEIDIYEGASKFETTGAGFGFWGESLTVCKKLGIEDRLTAIAPPGTEDTNFVMHFRKANLKEGKEMGSMVLSRIMAFHHAALLDRFVEIIKETNRATVHFGKRCVSYDQVSSTEKVTISFEDGTTATCHALVGCDGITSVVRKQLLKELGWKAYEQDSHLDSSGLMFTGTVAYQTLINPATLSSDHPALKVNKTYSGSNKHVVTYPIAGGRFINLVGYSSNPARYDEWKIGEWIVVEEGNEALIAEFGDLEEEIRVLLKMATKTSRWSLYEVEPIPHWSEGRVALLGDAAHAMTTYIGAGAGQLFEDAYILGQLLGSPQVQVTVQTIPDIFRSYEYVRKPRADKAFKCTREAKRIYQGLDKYADAKDVEKALDELVRWLWQGELDLDEEVVRGIKEFERLTD